MKNNTLVVDCRMSVTSINKLSEMGYNIVKMQIDNRFDSPISAHPDIFMTVVNGHLFVDSTVEELFTFRTDKFICGREVSCQDTIRYPDDVVFNCVNLGKHLICNKKYTHKSIVQYVMNNDIKIIDVNQGYAKCSTCVVAENAIITEDESIAEKATEAGIDVLNIEKGHVRLEGYDYGFIGGCSGLIEKDLLIFNGNIKKHPDYDKISAFCKKYGVETVSLSDEPLYDVGSIIRV